MSYRNAEVKGSALTVKDEGVSLTDGAESIDLIGNGVTGTAVGNDVSVTIPGGIADQVEIPSGDLDDVNTVFTVTNLPKQIFLNGAYQTAEGVDYTLSGSGPYTITFVTAPSSGSILRSIY